MSVFISYSRTDSEFVDVLLRLLVSKGYDVWVDRRSLEIGSRWDEQIEAAIRTQTHMLVVLSPEAVESENVADEWSFALEEGKLVIPLLIRACSVPMRLRRLQRLDFEHESFTVAFQALCDVLGAPDDRPADPVELARRAGFVLVDLGRLTGAAPIRIAFVYADYPQVGRFLRTVWFTLLWRVFDQFQSTDYGTKWALQNRTTQEQITLPASPRAQDMLLNEIGIEPGMQLEIVLL